MKVKLSCKAGTSVLEYTFEDIQPHAVLGLRSRTYFTGLRQVVKFTGRIDRGKLEILVDDCEAVVGRGCVGQEQARSVVIDRVVDHSQLAYDEQALTLFLPRDTDHLRVDLVYENKAEEYGLDFAR